MVNVIGVIKTRQNQARGIIHKDEVEEEEEEEESDDMDEFYRHEIGLMNDWEEEVENKILPEQYWNKDKANLFETTEYESCFDDQPFEEYNQLCYLIKLN